MSWDILIFNADRKIDLDDPDIDKYLIPFDFKRAIDNYFENIDRSESNFWEITREGFTIDYYSEENLQTNIMLNIYGERGLFELIPLAKLHRWQIYDSGLNNFIDINNPEINGHIRFKEYLKQIFKK